MRRRPLKWATMGVAIVSVAMLVNGSEARVWGVPTGAENRPQGPVAVAQAPPPVLPQPPASFDGLDARTRQAAAEAARAGATIDVVVLDRNTGQVVANGANQTFPIASVAKLFIADDLLLQVANGETTLTAAERNSLDRMLRSSDDGAAQTFWDRSGENAIIARVVARYGLTATTAPPNGHWDVTLSTASDLVRYYAKLLDGSGGLPAKQADVIMNNLAQSTPTGTDGYPQRFGIPEGLYAEPVAVKQGWFCCWNGGNQLHVSTGAIGADRRYVMAMGSLDPTGAAAARDRMTQFVKTMFPGGKV